MAYSSMIIFLAFCVVILSMVFQSSPNKLPSRCSTIKIEGYYCVELTLNSTLHYLYSPTNATISVVFTAAPPTPSGWVAWGINPKGEGMIGAGVIATFKDDTGVMTMRTINLKGYYNIVYENLTFDVWGLKAEESNGVMTIHATLKIPNNAKKVSHTWQVGKSVSVDGKLNKHESESENENAKGRLTLKEDEGSSAQGDWSKKAHALINTLAWGILNPCGLIAARYLKMFPWADPAWLCIHICCHFAAYVVGFIGGLVGMNIGNPDIYLYVEIALVCLASIQNVAFFQRPKEDSNYYRVWKIFHTWIGYLIVAIGTYNVYKGFAVLNPEELWISIFTYVQLILDASLVLLEGNYWRVYYKNQSNGSNQEPGNEM